MIDAFEATYFGSVPGWAVIVFIWGAAGILFTAQVVQAARLIRLGGPDDRFQDIGGRMREWLSGWLGQKRVLEDRVIGTLHAMIFWGFLALATDMFDLASGGRFEPLLAGISPMLANSWNLLVDMGYLLAAIGTFGALYRRVIVKPPKMEHESMVEGISILLTILGICGTAFIIEAHAGAGRWEPVGAWVAANLMTNFSASTQAGLAASSYWLHMMLIAGFLVAIPASKHMHLVTALPAVIFHDREPSGKMRPLAVGEDGKAVPLDELDIDTFGVGSYDQFSWRSLLDGWVCTTCFRCQDVCPAYASGKSLNPMQIIHDLRDYANEHAPILLAGGTPEESIIDRFTPEAIWACTTCNACVDACPVYIEHVPKLTDARRHLVMEAMEYPEQLNVAMGNLENSSNPYGFGAHERGDWAADLGVKINEPAEYIYFVGCAASFDERNQKVARATISLLQEAGLDVGILGMSEGCSGDPARRMGNEYLFQMLAESNMATFQELGVKRIIASCPHCFHTLGKEYGDYGGDELEVLHHSEIIAKLQEEGRLPDMEKNGKNGRKITYHDPCYLGRIGGVTEAPRNVIGGVDVEPERHGKDSFCCGAGGAMMWMEEDPDKRVNEIRAKELAETGCDTVAVGCPFCSIMVNDGLNSVGAEMDVMDVAELLWEQMQAKLAEAEKLEEVAVSGAEE
jgi:Fe-S oxidoreductase